MTKRCSLFIYFLVACLSMLLMSSFAVAAKAPLPAEQAFVFSASLKDNHEILASWRLAPGYYLYAKRLHISLQPTTQAEIRVPQGKLKYDQTFGQQEVFFNQLLVPIVLKASGQTVQLKVEYQGCSERGFCYPPIHKSVSFTLAQPIAQKGQMMTNPASFSWTLLTDQNGVRALFHDAEKSMLLLLFVGLGLLLSFTPCVLPMIPILTGMIIGQKQKLDTRKAFVLSSIYVLGSALTYALAGLMVAYLGSSLQVWLQRPWIIASVSGLFVLLALSLFGVYHLQLPSLIQNRLMKTSDKQQRGSYTGAFCMGMLSSLMISPCVTAPLMGVLIYIAETGDMLFGASALFAMGIGMGIPLVAIGMSAGKWLPKAGPWMEVVKKLFGVLMIGMAIWILSRLLSSTVTQLLFSAWLVGAALFVGLYLPRLVGRPMIHRGIGLTMAISGILVMGGMDATSLMQPSASRQATVLPTFTRVHNVAELKQQLALAKKEHQAVMIDFYADWCESCIIMDRQVFAVPEVAGILKHYRLLRADITANNEQDREILKQFNVIAPPTVLFFNAEGREVYSQRIVGEVNKTEFLNRLNVSGNEVALKK